MADLDQLSRDVLDLERSWRRMQGSKAGAIRRRLGLSTSRYYRILNRLLDDPDVLRYDPLLVKRLRRSRSDRRRQRFMGGDLRLGR